MLGLPKLSMMIAAMVSCALVLAPPITSADTTVSGSGTVNAIDSSERKLSITHDPIPALKWPAMTMDFAVSKDVHLEEVEVGRAVVFELHKSPDGSYVIESLEPAHKLHDH